MIYWILAFLLISHSLAVPVDLEDKEKPQQTPLKPELGSLKAPADKVPLDKSDDLEADPSVWFSYHHSFNSYPPPPLIIPRPRVYSYYADYSYTPYYWSSW
ncbi:unnamed protein product [Leptosia nina]|uniref:Uncharacterized protein n=1 Tax=Leptosia nina TaxID=320188 RepID=A0AAV1JTJ2_9NEOP